MCCCILATAFRIVIAVINIVFILVGLGMVIIGAILNWGWSTFKDEITPILKGISDVSASAGGGTVNTDQFDLGSMLSGVATALIVGGLFVICLSFLGCCGACYNLKIFMLIYGIALTVLFVAQLLIIIIYFAADEGIKARIKEPMVESITNNYEGLNSTEAITVGWNFAMLGLECCGVNDHKDFDGATKWRKTYRPADINIEVVLKVPIACCKLDGKFPDVTRPRNYSCAYEPTAKTTYMDRGCFTALEDLISAEKGGLVTGLVFYGLGQLVLIFCAFFVYKDDGIAKILPI